MASLVVALILIPAHSARALDAAPQPVAASATYSTDELVNAGHEFFGQTSSGLAAALSELFARFGLPNGYVLGEEASGAIFGGLRYGEGALQVLGAPPEPVFWQGPSVGWDFGGSGSRVMMLVYNLKSPQDLMQRFTGVDGSAYLVGGVSMTVIITVI
ncbi:MAG: EipA family protein, partial [Pseudomonadota bacterium]